MNSRGTFIFLCILFFFLLKGIFFIFLIPPYEAPDEPGHINYVFYLYHNKKLPDVSVAPSLTHSLVSSWNYQKKYLLPSLVTGKNMGHHELFNRTLFTKTQSLNNITEYPPLYYLYLLPFLAVSLYFSSYMTYILLAFGSLLLGILSVVLSFKIAHFIFPKTSLPYVIMGLVALMPMFGFMYAVVNNDAMVILFFEVFIYLVLRNIIFADSGQARMTKRLILIGFFAGVSAFVKPQLLILPVIYMITLFVQFKISIDWKKYTYIVLSTFCIPLCWYGLKYLLEGGSSLSYAFVSKESHSVSILQYPLAFLKAKEPIGIFMSFWGLFGWLDIAMQKYIYGLFGILMVIALIGWIFKGKSKLSKIQNQTWIFFAVTSVLYTSFIFLYDILFFAKGGHFGIQGRYFLPLLPILLIAMIQGFLFYGKKLSMTFIIFCVGVFLLGQILMYVSISKAYYHGYYVVSPLTNVYLK